MQEITSGLWGFLLGTSSLLGRRWKRCVNSLWRSCSIPLHWCNCAEANAPPEEKSHACWPGLMNKGNTAFLAFLRLVVGRCHSCKEKSRVWRQLACRLGATQRITVSFHRNDTGAAGSGVPTVGIPSKRLGGRSLP